MQNVQTAIQQYGLPKPVKNPRARQLDMAYYDDFEKMGIELSEQPFSSLWQTLVANPGADAVANDTALTSAPMYAQQLQVMPSFMGKRALITLAEMMVTQGVNSTSFGTILDNATSNLIRTIGKATNFMLFQSGYGEMAQIDNVDDTNSIITLVPNGDIRKLYGQTGVQLVFAPNISAGALRNGGVPVPLVSASLASNTLTFAPGTVPSDVASGDWIFYDGNRENSPTPSMLMPPGFVGWVPPNRTEAYLNTPFFNIKRATQDNLWAGFYYKPSDTAPLYQLMMDMQQNLLTQDARPKFFIMSPDVYNTLSSELQGKTTYFYQSTSEYEPSLNLGTTKVRTFTPENGGTPMICIVDYWCNNNQIWAITPHTFSLCAPAPFYSAGNDGININGRQRLYSDDEIRMMFGNNAIPTDYIMNIYRSLMIRPNGTYDTEISVHAMNAFICTNPSMNGVIDLTTWVGP